jgi:NADH-quinone oxidoreductase subunit C
VSDDVTTGGPTAAVAALQERWGSVIAECEDNRGQWRLELSEREPLLEMVTFLRDDPSLKFDFLVDITGLDHYGEEPRFRAIYVLRSMTLNDDIVLKVSVPEDDIWAPSLTSLFASANWLEREVYDMFGIEFKDHPDMRRILMPDMFEDFPLRKDFPMEGTMTDQEWAEWIISRAQRVEE